MEVEDEKIHEWVEESLLFILTWWIPTLIHLFYLQCYEKVAVQMAPRKVPPRLRGHFSQEDYERSRKYTLASINFDVVSSIYRRVIETILVVVIFRFGFPRFIGNLLSPDVSYTDMEYVLCLLYCYFLYFLLKDLTGLPLEIYFTFVLQENYGLNRLTRFTFLREFLDKIVPDVIQVLLTYPFYDGSLGIRFRNSLLAVVIIKFLFGLPFPLYRSCLRGQKHIKNGPLKDKLESLAEHVGFPKKEIYIFHESKSSLESDAYYLGIIFKRRIVLYDTLIKDYQCDCADKANNNCCCEHGLANSEVEAIFCHELGRWSRGHVRNSILIFTHMWLFLEWLESKKFPSILKYFVQKIRNLFGFKLGTRNFQLFTVLIKQSLSQLVLTILFMALDHFSRTFEFEADEIAVNRGYGYSLQTALIKLYKDNLVFPISDPLYSKLYHSHPTLIERLEAIDQRIHELQ